MVTPEEIATQYELLAAHRRTLATLLIQRARLGPSYTPPGVVNDIDAARNDIRRAKRTLREWGEIVVDHPNDEPDPISLEQLPTPPLSSDGRQPAKITIIIEGEVHQFNPFEQQLLIFALARLIEVSADEIRILRVLPGSIQIDLEMPYEAAERLIQRYNRRDLALQRLRIISIELLPHYPDNDDRPSLVRPGQHSNEAERRQVINSQQRLLAAYRGTLAHHLTQHAALGDGFVPPALATGIREARENIGRIKATLADWGAPAADDPNDDEPATPAPAAPAGQPEPGAAGSILSMFPDEGWFTGRAENEQEVEGLVSSFVDIGHFRHVFGNPRRPESVILFAEDGCGKTSYCVQVARRAIEGQYPALAVMFDFSRLLQGQIALDIYLDIIAQQTIVALDAQLRKEPEQVEPLRRDAELAARFCAIHEQHHVPQRIASHPAAQVEEAKQHYRLLGFRQRLGFLHQIIGGLGFASVYVLIDGVDEWPQTSDPQMAVSYLRPLLDSPQMLNGTGFAFKFFLPSRLRAYIHTGQPFIEVVELVWEDQQLHQMLSERLRAAWRGSQTAPGLMSFAELCQADFDVDELLVQAARGSPRRLMQLTRQILQIHSRTASEAEPLVSAATIQRVVGELRGQAHT